MTSRSWEALVVEGKRLHRRIPSTGGPSETSRSRQFHRARTERNGRRLKKSSRNFPRHRYSLQCTQGLSPNVRRVAARKPHSDISHAKHSRYAARPNRVNLLLNDDLEDGLSVRVREKVERAEDLLADQEVRDVLLDRTRTRSQRIRAVARAFEDEELLEARVNAKMRRREEAGEEQRPRDQLDQHGNG